MTDADVPALGVLMAAMAAAFDRTVSPGQLELYFMAMQDLDIAAVKAAVVRLIREKKDQRLPTVAEIREFAGAAAQGSGASTLADRAVEAASKVWAAIEHVGSYQSVCFDDPVIHAVIKRQYGGWVKLCSTATYENDGQKWFLKDFAKAYESYARAGTAEEGKLIGAAEGSNAANGLACRVDPPVLIGDQHRAMHVLTAGQDKEPLRIGQEDVKALVASVSDSKGVQG